MLEAEQALDHDPHGAFDAAMLDLCAALGRRFRREYPGVLPEWSCHSYAKRTAVRSCVRGALNSLARLASELPREAVRHPRQH